jgi:DUF3017 family protein
MGPAGVGHRGLTGAAKIGAMAEQYGPQGPSGPPRSPEGSSGDASTPYEPYEPYEGLETSGRTHPAFPYGTPSDPYDEPGTPPYEPSPSERSFAEAHPAPGPPAPPRGAEHVKAEPAVPRWLARLPYAFVLCGVAAGLAVVATNHFRRGSMLIAASVFIGALARLVLPESQVGMLAVRRRWLDVLLLTAAAVGITLVAFVAKGTSG